VFRTEWPNAASVGASHCCEDGRLQELSLKEEQCPDRCAKHDGERHADPRRRRRAWARASGKVPAYVHGIGEEKEGKAISPRRSMFLFSNVSGKVPTAPAQGAARRKQEHGRRHNLPSIPAGDEAEIGSSTSSKKTSSVMHHP